MNPPFKELLLRLRWQILHMNRQQALRKLYRITRPASYPYISGDGFRRLARHVYDEKSRHLSPRSIQQQDTVFVSTDYVREFFEQIDPGIRQPYTLITHNSDLAVDEALTALCSHKTQFWFAQNNSHAHTKVIPIPIGLENLHHYKAGIPSLYSALNKYAGPRRSRILVGFSMTNRVERASAQEIAARSPCAESLPGRLDQEEYLRRLVTYRFVLSPPGNGLDTHRAWEAMYLGVVPIVKDSTAMRAFRTLGLPMWIVDDWDELLSIRERDLETKYEELRSGFDCPALFMDYWRNVVLGPRRSTADPEAGNARREVRA